jgi:hypothetical protein
MWNSLPMKLEPYANFRRLQLLLEKYSNSILFCFVYLLLLCCLLLVLLCLIVGGFFNLNQSRPFSTKIVFKVKNKRKLSTKTKLISANLFR